MYCILMDQKTKSFYMHRGELKFYAYSDEENCDLESLPIGANMVITEMDDYQEFMTFLYNAGFCRGYMDDKEIVIRKKDVLYFKQNSNEVIYAQFLLTKDQRFLEIIKKSNLFTLCSIDNDQKIVFFPTVSLENGETAVLAYTDVSRIPEELFNKYKGYRIVRMTFDATCVVNGKFIAA